MYMPIIMQSLSVLLKTVRVGRISFLYGMAICMDDDSIACICETASHARTLQYSHFNVEISKR